MQWFKRTVVGGKSSEKSSNHGPVFENKKREYFQVKSMLNKLASSIKEYVELWGAMAKKKTEIYALLLIFYAHSSDLNKKDLVDELYRYHQKPWDSLTDAMAQNYFLRLIGELEAITSVFPETHRRIEELTTLRKMWKHKRDALLTAVQSSTKRPPTADKLTDFDTQARRAKWEYDRRVRSLIREFEMTLDQRGSMLDRFVIEMLNCDTELFDGLTMTAQYLSISGRKFYRWRELPTQTQMKKTMKRIPKSSASSDQSSSSHHPHHSSAAAVVSSSDRHSPSKPMFYSDTEGESTPEVPVMPTSIRSASKDGPRRGSGSVGSATAIKVVRTKPGRSKSIARSKPKPPPRRGGSGSGTGGGGLVVSTPGPSSSSSMRKSVAVTSGSAARREKTKKKSSTGSSGGSTSDDGMSGYGTDEETTDDDPFDVDSVVSELETSKTTTVSLSGSSRVKGLKLRGVGKTSDGGSQGRLISQTPTPAMLRSMRGGSADITGPPTILDGPELPTRSETQPNSPQRGAGPKPPPRRKVRDSERSKTMTLKSEALLSITTDEEESSSAVNLLGTDSPIAVPFSTSTRMTSKTMAVTSSGTAVGLSVDDQSRSMARSQSTAVPGTESVPRWAALMMKEQRDDPQTRRLHDWWQHQRESAPEAWYYFCRSRHPMEMVITNDRLSPFHRMHRLLDPRQHVNITDPRSQVEPNAIQTSTMYRQCVSLQRIRDLSRRAPDKPAWKTRPKIVAPKPPPKK